MRDLQVQHQLKVIRVRKVIKVMKVNRELLVQMEMVEVYFQSKLREALLLRRINTMR